MTARTPLAGEGSLLRRAWASRSTAYLASRVPGRPRRFLILCVPRSGSELLVDLMNDLPGLTCEGELLVDHVRWPHRFLDGRARQAGARGAKVWGCKILGQHLMWHEGTYGPGTEVLQRFVDAGWQLIHLRRDDLLASALSALHAEQSKRWHFQAGEEVEYQPVDLDAIDVLAWLYSYDAQRTWLDQAVAGVPHLRLTYESELRGLDRRQSTLDRVAAHLGVASASVSTSLTAIAPTDPWSRLADPESVRQALRLTRLAHLAD